MQPIISSLLSVVFGLAAGHLPPVLHEYVQSERVDGTYAPLTRTYSVRMPSGFTDTTLLCLHGAGGTRHVCDQIMDISLDFMVKDSLALVSLDAHQQQWNSNGQSEGYDDVVFIQHVAKTMADVYGVPRCILLGHSRGAFMLHRVMVESDLSNIVAGIAIATQLPEELFQNGDFVLGSSVQKIRPRSLVILLGEMDPMVSNEYTPDSLPGIAVPMLSMSDSAHAYAVAYNQNVNVSQIAPTLYDGAFSVYYPTVEAHVILGAGHSVVDVDAGRRRLHDNAVLGVPCIDHQSNCIEKEEKCHRRHIQWRCASTCQSYLARDTQPYDYCRMVRSQGKCFKTSVREECQRTCCGLKF